jgi:hypothetical protein
MKPNKPYVVVQSKYSGLDALKLTEQPFEGIIYSYGKIDFEEDEANDTVRLKFEYEILDDNGKKFTDKKPFENYIGKILEELIHEGIEENSLIYTGGVDENRTKDSDESDL